LPEQASLRVLDLFLLEGMQSNKIIFDVTLGYLRVINDKVVACKDQETLQKVMNPAADDFDNCDNLINQIKIARSELKQTHIDFYRPVSHKDVLDDVHRQIKQKSLYT
jgi:hypothetical protein